MTKRARGLEAPFAAADAIPAAMDLPFEEGLKKEFEGFNKLLESEQSKAQRYAFLAERAANKLADLPEGTKPRSHDELNGWRSSGLERWVVASRCLSLMPAFL